MPPTQPRDIQQIIAMTLAATIDGKLGQEGSG